MNQKPPRMKRMLTQDGEFNAVAIGRDRRAFGDLYHRLIRSSWILLILGFMVLYQGIAFVFALGYWGLEDSIRSSHPIHFLDAFFFSVHTLSTIGYGAMSPAGLYANILVTMEAMVGLGVFVVATGLLFAKFSLPTARVMFSRRAVVQSHNGTDTLKFRVANARGNQILRARVQVVLAMDHTTEEGESFRRLVDLPLVRNNTPIMAMTWTVMHRIDETSPLHGYSPEELHLQNAELLIVLMGMDETVSKTIHARHSYIPGEIEWNRGFVPMLKVLADGRRAIDFEQFHEVQRS